MEQKRKQNEDVPNRSSNTEQADDSRENIKNSELDEQGMRKDRHRRGGITNRSHDRELDEQQRLPDRGRTQSER